MSHTKQEPPDVDQALADATMTPTPVDDPATAAANATPAPAVEKPELDVEHLVCDDDPRLWSKTRKNVILATIAVCAMAGTISASIFFPATNQLQEDLNANDGLIGASVSLFILGQGFFPVLWSAIAEIKGRKICYIISNLIYIAASVVCSRANNIGLFVAFRLVQALGSGAVLVLGAATLADIFDVHERGFKIGIFYSMPLTGPALGPLIGGALTDAFDWRATFFFLVIYGVICLGLFIWLPETFRKERSLAWRKAMARARAHARADRRKARGKLPGGAEGRDERQEKTARPPTQTAFSAALPTPSRADGAQSGLSPLHRVKSALSLRSGEDNVKIHLRDVNPLAATGAVLGRLTNFIAIAFSGLLFASQYCVTFTASRTFADAPYNLNALEVGLVLLSFGSGNVLGSILGGKYSDYKFLRLSNGGKGEPEMRIKSSLVALPCIPVLFVAYAWTVQYRTSIVAPIVILFFLGFATIWVYSTLLAYVVDANAGQSSSAVACNSLFRGVLACVASQAAEPIIQAIGNGAFYSGFAVILLVGEASLVVIGVKGKSWREAHQAKEAAARERKAREAEIAEQA